jgi:hypothetical protein
MFFNLFWFTAHFGTKNKIGGTLTWQKMTICN